MSEQKSLKAIRGNFLDIVKTVEQPEEIESHLRFIEDGLMLVRSGKVEWFGQWEEGNISYLKAFVFVTIAAR